MPLDYSKIASAMTTFSQSPSAKQTNRYGISQILAMKDLQEQKVQESRIAHQSMLKNAEDTLAIARKLAVREKDMPVLVNKVQNAGQKIADKIKNDFGGNLTHFYNSIGPEFLTSMSLEIFQDSDIKAISRNVGEYEKFIEAQKKGQPIFNSVENASWAFREGHIDTFEYGLPMIEYEQPKEGYISDHVGEDRVDVMLGFGNNMTIALQNYIREYNLDKKFTPEELENISIDEIRNYANAYIGAKGEFSKIKGSKGSTEDRYADNVSDALDSLGVVNIKDIPTLESVDESYKTRMGALSNLAFMSDEELGADFHIHGKKVFNEFLTPIVEAFFEGAAGWTQSGVPVGPDGQQILLSQLGGSDGGNIFDQAGGKMDGVTLGESFSVMGAVLAYKTPDGGRLIMKDEMTPDAEGRAIPTIVVALQDDGAWIGGNTFGWGQETIYKEINFNNPAKAEKLNKLLKIDEKQYEENLEEMGQVSKEGNLNVTFGDVGQEKFNAKPERLKEFAAHYNSDLTKSMQSLGVNEPSLAMKSMILAIGTTSINDVDNYINNLHQIYNSSRDESAHTALLSNDPKKFLQALIEGFESQGQDPEKLAEFERLVNETAKAIYNSMKS